MGLVDVAAVVALALDLVCVRASLFRLLRDIEVVDWKLTHHNVA